MAYGTRGWEDEYEDESKSGLPRSWKHELKVRPSAQFNPSELVHGFVADVFVTTFAWEDGKNSWTQLGDRALIYFGEHLSLVAGVRAVRKAYARSMVLRDGPGDE